MPSARQRPHPKSFLFKPSKINPPRRAFSTNRNYYTTVAGGSSLPEGRRAFRRCTGLHTHTISYGRSHGPTHRWPWQGHRHVKVNIMEIKDYCKNVDVELSRWQGKFFDVVNRFDQMSTGSKQRVFEDVNGLHIVLAELDDRLATLRNQCPIAWKPDRGRYGPSYSRIGLQLQRHEQCLFRLRLWRLNRRAGSCPQ